jgi:hypothetical protein
VLRDLGCAGLRCEGGQVDSQGVSIEGSGGPQGVKSAWRAEDAKGVDNPLDPSCAALPATAFDAMFSISAHFNSSEGICPV